MAGGQRTTALPLRQWGRKVALTGAFCRQRNFRPSPQASRLI
jgi:hypothetical protein